VEGWHFFSLLKLLPEFSALTEALFSLGVHEREPFDAHGSKEVHLPTQLIAYDCLARETKRGESQI
jgi:hypothetical protein